MIDQVRLLSFPKKDSFPGSMSMIESCNHTPFSVKRVGYLYDLPAGSERLGYAYRGQEQVIIAISGSFELLVDDGIERDHYRMNIPYTGVYIPANIWVSMNQFSSGATVLILGSNRCSIEGYIADYSVFIAGVGESLDAVAFDERFLNESWEWFNRSNNEDLRYFSEFQTKPEQLEWFEQLPHRSDLHIWGVTCNDAPVGVIELRDVTRDSARYRGYIGDGMMHNELFFRWMIQKGEEMAALMNLKILYVDLLIGQTTLINFYIHQGYLFREIKDEVLQMCKEVAIEDFEEDII